MLQSFLFLLQLPFTIMVALTTRARIVYNVRPNIILAVFTAFHFLNLLFKFFIFFLCNN